MAGYTEAQLDLIYDRSNGACHLCHKVLERDNYAVKGVGGWQVDHSNPASRGGSDSFRNLRAACTGCNAEKGNMSTAAYRKQKGVEGMPPSFDANITEMLNGSEEFWEEMFGDVVAREKAKTEERKRKKELEQRRAELQKKRGDALLGAAVVAGLAGGATYFVFDDWMAATAVGACAFLVLLVLVQQWYNPDRLI